MWEWFLKLIGVRKPLLEAPPCNLAIALAEVEKEAPPQDLLLSLAKARQEALDPVLPDHLAKAVDDLVNQVFPERFKKAIIAKEDLFLISKLDLENFQKVGYSERYSEDDWNTIVVFAIRILKKNGIAAEKTSSSCYISCKANQILDCIKNINFQPETENSEIPKMNSIGIYR